MRLAKLAFLASASILAFLYKDEIEGFVGSVLSSPEVRETSRATPGLDVLSREIQTVKTAHDGLGCLAGTNPCPGGRPSPF